MQKLKNVKISHLNFQLQIEELKIEKDAMLNKYN